MLKILQVEDDPSQVVLMRAVLKGSMREEYELSTADRLSVALGKLAGEGADVVLLDLNLPDSRGLETFTTLREHAPHSAIIVFSGTSDEDLALKTLQNGAQDYLVKTDVDRRLIVRAIRYAVERKRVADQLWENEERTRLIIETAHDAFAEMDADGLITDWNPRAQVLFGWPQAEAKQRNFVDTVIAPEFRAAARRLFQKAHETEHGSDQVAVESVAVRRNGECFPVELTIWQVRTRRSYRFNAFVHDITARKRAARELAEEHDLLQSVIEGIPDQIYAKDSSGKFVRANSAVARFLGLPDGDALKGRTDFDLFPAGMAQQWYDEEQRIIHSGLSVVNREACVTDRDGAKRWELTTKAPIRDHAGKIAGIVGINRDITAIKEAESRLKQANAELERSQAELQQTLAELQRAHNELHGMQLQLIEVEKMHTIGRLAAGVAHEVKNPLALMLRGINYLSKTPAGQEAVFAGVLKDMHDAIGRADVVIRGMLDFASPRNIEALPEDINAIIEASLRFVKHEVQDHHVIVTQEIERNLPLARVDRQKFQEVFINVFENAIYATPANGSLVVRTYSKTITGFGANVGGNIDRFSMGDRIVVIEIDDTGTGIPPDKLSKIFDPFFTTKPTGQGTGLGLSVCKTIMDLHGGTIEITNRPSGGARCTLMLKADEITPRA